MHNHYTGNGCFISENPDDEVEAFRAISTWPKMSNMKSLRAGEFESALFDMLCASSSFSWMKTKASLIITGKANVTRFPFNKDTVTMAITFSVNCCKFKRAQAATTDRVELKCIVTYSDNVKEALTAHVYEYRNNRTMWLIRKSSHNITHVEDSIGAATWRSLDQLRDCER